MWKIYKSYGWKLKLKLGYQGTKTEAVSNVYCKIR